MRTKFALIIPPAICDWPQETVEKITIWGNLRMLAVNYFLRGTLAEYYLLYLTIFKKPMKKNIMLSGMLAFLVMTACNNSPKEETTSTPPPAEKTAPPAPAGTKQEDGTTIKMNDQGVSIESKDGTKKTNVSVSKDSTNLEISRPK
jgi:hypothetical protein